MSAGKCQRCRKRTAISVATPYCDACLYAEEMGADKALIQTELATRERDRVQAARKAKRG